jgi:MerR family mercuric resistance operon transcriptional regulator
MSSKAKTRAWRIGEAAQRSGVGIDTIRYYERIGVLQKAARSRGGRRQYGEKDIWRLAFIRRSRSLGFPLEDIRHLLAMVDSRMFTCAEIHALATAHLEAIRREIASLKALDRELTEITSRCNRDNTPDCPVLDALSSDEQTD